MRGVAHLPVDRGSSRASSISSLRVAYGSRAGRRSPLPRSSAGTRGTSLRAVLDPGQCDGPRPIPGTARFRGRAGAWSWQAERDLLLRTARPPARSRSINTARVRERRLLATPHAARSNAAPAPHSPAPLPWRSVSCSTRYRGRSCPYRRRTRGAILGVDDHRQGTLGAPPTSNDRAMRADRRRRLRRPPQPRSWASCSCCRLEARRSAAVRPAARLGSRPCAGGRRGVPSPPFTASTEGSVGEARPARPRSRPRSR